MVDGTYSIMLNTPIGVKKGELVFVTDGTALRGAIVVKGVDNPLYFAHPFQAFSAESQWGVLPQKARGGLECPETASANATGVIVPVWIEQT